MDDSVPVADAASDAIEYCYAHGWTDGLPVVPCTPGLLDAFLARTARAPDDVLLAMPQLNRACTVRLAALNAAMAGCLPEYFPVVLAAWDSLREEEYAGKGIWQSTTGTAVLLVVNGPARERLGINCRGNVFGPGFRANATIGRAIRLAALNVFGVRPHALDQATQGTPAKYTCCIGENEEESPWPAFCTEFVPGPGPTKSTVTAMTMRSVAQIEARHTSDATQLLRDIADTIARTGALIHRTISSCLVLSPEHARLLAGQGWERPAIRRFLFEQAAIPRDELDRVGKGAISGKSHWRLPADHPDAVPDDRLDGGALHVLTSPDAVQVVVAGASNSGVSAVVDTFGPRGGRPAVVAVEDA